MDDINSAVKLALEKFVSENGMLKDGDEFVTVFNNFCLYTKCEDGKMTLKIIGGKPYVIDMSLDIFEEDGNETD